MDAKVKLAGIEALEAAMQNARQKARELREYVLEVQRCVGSLGLEIAPPPAPPDGLSHERTFSFEAQHGTKVEVNIKVDLTDLDKADLEDILHDFAMYTHNVYLSLGRAISAEGQ